jgi:hypothetical protein
LRWGIGSNGGLRIWRDPKLRTFGSRDMFNFLRLKSGQAFSGRLPAQRLDRVRAGSKQNQERGRENQGKA